MKLKKLVLAACLSQLSALAYAAAPMPAALMNGKKPIDSLCFFNIAENHQIDLKNCGATHEKYKVVKGDADLLKKGYVGYNWKDPSVPEGVQGYSYYRYFAAGNNKYWIYSINNSGGSGDFSAVYLAERKDDNTLVVENVVGGDRCNGGVNDVTGKDNALSFNVNLTAYDLVSYADDKKLASLQAYDDLAACATCCVASAAYTINSGEKVKLEHINLSNMKEDELSDQGKYQVCFNKIFSSYVSKKETMLDEKKLTDFVDEFKKTCIDANKGA